MNNNNTNKYISSIDITIYAVQNKKKIKKHNVLEYQQRDLNNVTKLSRENFHPDDHPVIKTRNN